MAELTERTALAASKAVKRSVRLRAAAIFVHRWVGLVMMVFLIVAGLTGSMMAFYPQLDAELNPELYKVAPPSPDAALLDPIDLQERIRAQFPESEINGAILFMRRDRSVNYWIDERETFVDPYTARVLGTRKFGDIREGRKTILTFLYELHFTLALGDVGIFLFGLIATLWTIDCFVGAYITLPPRSARAQKKPWLARWWPAWLLKTNTLFTTVFTWHRASGLWVWGFLLVFAWSAVALNFGEEVYEPVMNSVLPGHVDEHLPELDPPREQPALDLRAARARAREVMAEQAEQRGFEVFSERWLFYEADHGVYSYTVDSSFDIDERLAETTVYIDGDTGELVRFHAPGHDARSTFDIWLIGLHFGAVRSWGLAYRAFVCVLGVLVAVLSVTGVWIWLRKRTKKVQPTGA